MADLNYTARVDVTQADAGLSQLQRSVTSLNATFVRLKTTLATISLGSVISGTLQFADAISDLSDASGIAIGNIIGFQNAVMASGGSAEGAQKAILRLVNSIGEAADGSEELQKAFKAVGVSINDLRTLSEEDILKKTIDGLDKMEDRAKRSVLITQLLGKEFRNVATGGLGAAYAEASAQAAKYSDAIAKGAAAQQNIDKTLGEFKIGILEALKPLTELISSINVGVETFQRFVQAVLAIGAVLAAVFVGGKIIAGARILYGVFIALFEAISGGISIVINFVRNFEMIMANITSASGLFSGLRALISAVGSTLAEVLAPAFGVLKSVAMPVLAGIAGYWGWIQESTGKAIDKIKEYLNYLPGVNFTIGGGAGRGDGQAEIEQRKRDEEERKRTEEQRRQVRDREAEKEAQRQRKLKEALNDQRVQYMLLEDSQRTFSNYLRSDLQSQTERLNLSEDQRELQDALNQETNRYLQQQNSLQDKLRQVQAKIGFEQRYQYGLKEDDLRASNDKIEILSDEESRIRDLLKLYSDLHQQNGRAITNEIQAQQRIKNAEKERAALIEYNTQLIEQQYSSVQNLEEALRRINDQRIDIKVEREQQGLTQLQRQFAQIEESARKAALEAGRAFAATFDTGGDALTPERAQELADGLAKIAEGYRAIADQQRANLEASQTFEAGWRTAFENFYENATNAAKIAESSFSSVFNNIFSALDRFVETGKFSFKDFARSIILDLIKIELKANAMQMFKMAGLGGSGGGSFLSTIGNFFGGLFGGANGGPLDTSPLIVGERGPELFIPRSAGQLIANNKLGRGSETAQVTYITNNISAIDAKSVAQLFYENRQTLFGTVEQAKKELPFRQGAMA